MKNVAWFFARILISGVMKHALLRKEKTLHLRWTPVFLSELYRQSDRNSAYLPTYQSTLSINFKGFLNYTTKYFQVKLISHIHQGL